MLFTLSSDLKSTYSTEEEIWQNRNICVTSDLSLVFVNEQFDTTDKTIP